jgi:hypothetical protein
MSAQLSRSCHELLALGWLCVAGTCCRAFWCRPPLPGQKDSVFSDVVFTGHR